MQIKDLKQGMKNVEVEAVVDMVGKRNDKKEYGIEYDFIPIMIYDGSGDIRITIFGALAKKVKEGMKLKIKNGYTTEYNGQLQLNAKDTDITVVS
jgi:ssDNA-binding replication factor A large subunit